MKQVAPWSFVPARGTIRYVLLPLYHIMKAEIATTFNFVQPLKIHLTSDRPFLYLYIVFSSFSQYFLIYLVMCLTGHYMRHDLQPPANVKVLALIFTELLQS